MKTRIWEVMQYEKNPKTGESLNFDEKNIIRGLNHKTIKQWAYICHDKDIDVDGGLKNKHWHVVCRSDVRLEIETIAEWFGVPVQQVEIKKGAGAFLDCVEYLTHERPEQIAQGKHRYDDSEVIASEGFQWREELDNRTIKKLEAKKKYADKETIRLQVLKEGKSLRDVMEENPLIYANDMSVLTKLRAQYLATYAPLPPVRINYYIEGKGGIGKDVLAKILAKSLFPAEYDDDSYFRVGANGALFEGYDGQPCIIWSDRRSSQLLRELGGRGNVFNVFDTSPNRDKQNVKYSSACLVNAVNIINGTESYEDFLNGLAGEYEDKNGHKYKAEDKGQSYRRFPMIICLHESDFDMLVNRGFAEGTFEYQQYNTYKNMVGNFGSMKKRLESATSDVGLIDLAKPIIEKHHEIEEKAEERKISSADECPEEFWYYGLTQEQAEVNRKINARIKYNRRITENMTKAEKEKIALELMDEYHWLGKEDEDDIYKIITDETKETLPEKFIRNSDKWFTK